MRSSCARAALLLSFLLFLLACSPCVCIRHAESQSLFWERQVALSKPFARYLLPKLKVRRMPSTLGLWVGAAARRRRRCGGTLLPPDQRALPVRKCEGDRRARYEP